MISEERRDMSWSEVRQSVKDRNISKQQFRDFLIKKNKGASPKVILELIINHVYHSSEEHL